MRDKMAVGVVPRCLYRRRYEGTPKLPTDRLLPRTALPKEIRFRIAGTALFWKQRVAEIGEGRENGRGYKTGQDRTGPGPPTVKPRTFPRAGDPVSSRRRDLSSPRLCIFCARRPPPVPPRPNTRNGRARMTVCYSHLIVD